MTRRFDVFVCHSSQDDAIVAAIVSALERDGVRCWIAPRDVIAGRNWGEAIIEAIESCPAMLLVLSRSSNESQQVLQEVERAIARRVTVIPVRIHDVAVSRSLELYTGARHWLDAWTPPIERHVPAIASAIRHALGEREPVAPAPVVAARPGKRKVAIGLAVALAAIGGIAAWMGTREDAPDPRLVRERYEAALAATNPPIPSNSAARDPGPLITRPVVLDDVPLSEALRELGAASGTTIHIDPELAKATQDVNVTFAAFGAARVLDLLRLIPSELQWVATTDGIVASPLASESSPESLTRVLYVGDFTAAPETSAGTVAVEEVVNLIKEFASPGGWDTGRQQIDIVRSDEILFVGSADVLADTQRLLACLRTACEPGASTPIDLDPERTAAYQRTFAMLTALLVDLGEAPAVSIEDLARRIGEASHLPFAVVLPRDERTAPLKLRSGRQAALSLFKSVPRSLTIGICGSIVVCTDSVQPDPYNLFVRLYPIADLESETDPFAGLEFNLTPQGFVEDPEFAKALQPQPIVFERERLLELIKYNVDPESWDRDPAQTIAAVRGCLVVQARWAIHTQIESLLEQLHLLARVKREPANQKR